MRLIASICGLLPVAFRKKLPFPGLSGGVYSEIPVRKILKNAIILLDHAAE